MIEFKKNSKFGHTVFRLCGNKLGICIHRYDGYGESWFLSCTALEISALDLATNDFDEAVRVSQEIVSNHVKEIAKEALQFTNAEQFKIK